jgi:hypothetical protein
VINFLRKYKVNNLLLAIFNVMHLDKYEGNGLLECSMA